MAKEMKVGLQIDLETNGVSGLKKAIAELKAAGQNTDELEKELAELEQAFKRNAGVQNLTDKFKQLKKTSADLSGKMKETQQRIGELAREMKNSPSKKLEKEFNAATREAKRLKEQYQNVTKETQRVRSEMSAAGISTKNLAAEQRKLAISADAAEKQVKELANEAKRLEQIKDAKIKLGIDNDDKVKQQIEEVGKAYNHLKASGTLSSKELARANELHKNKVKELEASLQSAKPKMDDIALGMGKIVTAGAGLALVAKEAMEFETAMAGVKKVVDGTDEQMSQLGDQVKDLAYELAIVPEQVAAIAAQGGQLGVAFEDLPEFTRLAGQMSVAFGMTAEEAGNAAAKLTNVFGITLKEVSALGDAINTLGNNTAAKESEITAAMLRIGGSAKQFGLAAEQAAALADAFIALGKPPEVAATAINALLNRLQTGGEGVTAFKDGLEQLGISSEELAVNIKENPEKALVGFLEQLEKLDNQQRSIVLTKMFGQEYADDIALAAGSLDTFREALGLVADKSQNAGAMQREFEAAMSTTSAQVDQAKIAISNLTKTLGSELLPIIAGIADGIGGAANAINDFAEAHPVITRFATYLATAKVATFAFNSALKAMGYQSVNATQLASAGFARTSAALRGMQAQMVTASTAARGMSAGMAAQAAATTAANVATKGLAVALKAVAANPVGLGITALVTALTFLSSEAEGAGARFKEMKDAVKDADKAVETLQNRLDAGMTLDASDVEQSLQSVQRAIDKNRDAKLALDKEIANRDIFDEYIEFMKTVAPAYNLFFDTQAEQMEKINEAEQKLIENKKELARLAEEKRAEKALDDLIKKHEQALDKSKGINSESRQILNNLADMNSLVSIMTAEQVRALQTSLDALSSNAAVDEASANIKKLAAEKKITLEEEKALLEQLSEKRKSLAKTEEKAAEQAANAATLTSEEVEGLAKAYKSLSVEVPKAFATMSNGDKKVIEALQNIISNTDVSAEKMKSLLSSAFANVETEAAGQKIHDIYAKWLNDAGITRDAALAMTQDIFANMRELGANTDKELRKINLTSEEVVTGISKDAQDVIDGLGTLMEKYGSNTEAMERIFKAAMTKMNSPEARQALVDNFREGASAIGVTKDAMQGIIDKSGATTDALSSVFKKLNLDVNQSLTGVSSKTKETLDLIKQGATEVGNSTKSASEKAKLLADLFDTALNAAKTKEEFAALNEIWRQTGQLSQRAAQQSRIIQAGMQGGAEAAQAEAAALAQNSASRSENAEAASQQARASNNAASATQEHTEATKENAKATESAGASMAKLIAELINAEKASYRNVGLLKEQTAELDTIFDGLLSSAQSFASFESKVGDFTGFSTLASGIAGIGEAMREGAQKIKDYENDIAAMSAKLSDASVSTEDLRQAQQLLGGTVEVVRGHYIQLDETKLDNLNAAIEQARQRMLDLKQEAKDTADTLEAELARMRGDNSKTAQLEQERKLRELNAKLHDAELRRNDDEIAQYQRAIQLQQEIGAEKAKQAKQQAEEAKQREQEAKQREAERSKQRESTRLSSSNKPTQSSNNRVISSNSTFNSKELANSVASAVGERLNASEEQIIKHALQEFSDELRRAIKGRPY